MPKRLRFLSSLELGEVTTDFLHNPAEDFLKRVLKTGLNIILKAGGGAARRPGSIELADLGRETVRFTYRGRNETVELAFSDGRVDVIADDGTLRQTLTEGIVWTTSDLANLSFDSDANSVFIAAQSFPTQEMTRADDGTWSIAAFSFANIENGKQAQPFYDKFNDIDVTMAVSTYSGTGVAITFSDDVLVAGHVGKRFRYLGECEVEITTVTDARNGLVDIKDELYPTLVVNVDSSAELKTGQVVRGDVSDVQGIVSAIVSGTQVRITLLDGYTHFEYVADEEASTDKLIGPEGEATLTATPTLFGTPAIVSIWDEQLISSVRGYPGEVTVHKNRLILTQFPDATHVVCGSAHGNFKNFEVGVEPEDAFNEELGSDPNTKIRYAISAEQLLLLTNRDLFYVPEAPENPLTPTSIEFTRISPDGASMVRPVLASEGVLFIDADAGRLMIASMTGNVRRPWTVGELSEAAYHMLTGPKRMVVANGLDGRTERYALVLNSDGTLACMMYRRGSETVGFSRWTHGTGMFDDITVDGDRVRLTSKVGSRYAMSELSFNALVDDETDYAATLTGREGDALEVVQDRAVIGSGLVDSNGNIAGLAPAAGLTAGYDFDLDCTPAPQIDRTRGWQRMRVTKVMVDVIDSGTFNIGEVSYLPFTAEDPLDNPGKVRSGMVEGFQLGWSSEATKSINQKKGQGARLDIRSITMEVSS